jgi:hypothetical protein
VSSVYKVHGSIHDQILTEGAAEVVTEASAEISIVAQNIDAVIEVADAIPDDMSGIPDAVAEANAAATRAETAAESAVGIDAAAQGYANAAAASAAAAASSAAAVDEALENAGGTIDQIVSAVGDAEAAAELSRRWANEAPGVPVEDGKLSSLHYASATEVMFASAPNMQARVVGGTDPGFSNVAADFGRAIVVQRAASLPVKLTLAPALFDGPPKPDADLALAPLYLINASDTGSYLEIEGPGSSSTVLKPTVIAADLETDFTTSTPPPAEDHVFTLDIPAGSDRLAVLVAGVISHTTPSGGPTLTCGVAGSTVTQRATAGDGNQAGTRPIFTKLYTVAIPGSAAIPGAVFTLAVPAGMAGMMQALKVFQNVGGTEDYAATERAGAATSETQAFSPSQPGSTNLVFAFHQGASANPVNITPRDSIQQGKSGGTRSAKDFSYAIALDEDHAASASTYTGSSAASSPAVIGGLVLLPVTTAGGGSGDGMVWKGTRPCRVQPGEHAAAWASSDGTTYFLTYVPNP